VPNPTCFDTKVPSSGSLSTAKDHDQHVFQALVALRFRHESCLEMLKLQVTLSTSACQNIFNNTTTTTQQQAYALSQT
jgi:hypothetical protein